MERETKIKIRTTPRELRRIADKMESDMAKARLGEECPYHNFYDYSRPSDTLEVRLIADQDAYYNHMAGNKSKWT